MRLTKLGHSCVRLELHGAVLVIDPGSAPFADATTALAGADAVLVTHQHADHLDADAIRAAVAANPDLRVVVPTDTVAALPDVATTVTAAAPGEQLEVAGFSVTTVGGQHAVIHPEVPAPQNLGYLITGGQTHGRPGKGGHGNGNGSGASVHVGGGVYHPGDAFAVPTDRVQTLLVPVHAPWSKIAEVVEFVRAVAPARAVAIHDGLLNATGLGLADRHIANLGRTDYRRLAPGESIQL